MVATIPFPALNIQTPASSRPRPALQRDFGERIQGTASPRVLREALLNANATVSPTELFDEADFNRLWKRLQQMKSWRQGWDGYGALAPATRALRQAEDWSDDFFRQLTSNGIRFHAPLVTADADGTVVIEWRNKNKKLALYFAPSGEVEFLTTEEASKSEEDGNLEDVSDLYLRFTSWLMS